MEQRSTGMPEGPVVTTGAKAAGGGEDVSPAIRVQLLTTEHWSLLATRSLSWSEAFSRSSMFLSALTGSVVALALVGQAMPGEGFAVFALLLLPVVLFLGLATFARLVAINNEDILWVVGMNRLRHAYVQLVPDVEDYFISGVTDDVQGVMRTFGTTPGPGQFMHGFVTTPGMIGVIDSVLAGVLAGVVSGVFGAALPVSIAIGAVGFVAMLALLMVYQARAILRLEKLSTPRFPSA